MSYRAPLKDMHFALGVVAEVEAHAQADIISAVLDEAAKLAQGPWDGTNKAGDRVGSRKEGEGVRTPEGFADAYRQFVEGGWNGLTCPEEFGGQHLPASLGMAVGEMWQSANLALGLCPVLTQAAIEAIYKYGTPEQKAAYLPNLVSGVWTGTMQLTEPQAGSDLSAIRTSAKKTGDAYVLKGQKIFISWGEHDCAPNIIHLVLAHIDGMPDGNEGLGLFIVPKILADGARNDVRVVSVEHKMGIHGSPTCVMSYGDAGGATGYLVGEAGKGLRNMFTMMNAARISVGVQGVAVAERAYQRALSYARDRVQGAPLGGPATARVPIIRHADVRRMLLTMKAQTEAARALCYYAGGMMDRMLRMGDAQAAARVDLLTPLVKAWATDMAVETASLGIQIHGGMGFIEETGAAQHYRDARVLPIYEGTNGIQSNDLVFRKVARDSGIEARRLMAEMNDAAAALGRTPGDDAAVISAGLFKAVTALEETTKWIIAHAKSAPEEAAAAAQPYQRQFSVVAGGYVLALQARAAQEALAAGADPDFHAAKLVTARFFAESILPATWGLTPTIMGGHTMAVRVFDAQF